MKQEEWGWGDTTSNKLRTTKYTYKSYGNDTRAHIRVVFAATIPSPTPFAASATSVCKTHNRVGDLIVTRQSMFMNRAAFVRNLRSALYSSFRDKRCIVCVSNDWISENWLHGTFKRHLREWSSSRAARMDSWGREYETRVRIRAVEPLIAIDGSACGEWLLTLRSASHDLSFDRPSLRTARNGDAAIVCARARGDTVQLHFFEIPLCRVRYISRRGYKMSSVRINESMTKKESLTYLTRSENIRAPSCKDRRILTRK